MTFLQIFLLGTCKFCDIYCDKNKPWPTLKIKRMFWNLKFECHIKAIVNVTPIHLTPSSPCVPCICKFDKKVLTYKKLKNESNSKLSTFSQIVDGALAC